MRMASPPGGTIVQISSIGGFISTPGGSAYHATKHALEGFTKAVAREVSPDWNIKFINVEPGSVKTEWGFGNMQSNSRHPAYEGLAAQQLRDKRAMFVDKIGAQPQKVANVLVEAVEGGEAPMQFPLGADAWALARQQVDIINDGLREWRHVSESTSPGDVKVTLRELGLLKD